MERIFIPSLINRQIQWFELVWVRSYVRHRNGKPEHVRAYKRRVNRVSTKLYYATIYFIVPRLVYNICLLESSLSLLVYF